MGFFYAILAFIMASGESAGLSPEQSTVLFLQKLASIEETLLPFAIVLLFVGIFAFVYLISQRRATALNLVAAGGTGCLVVLAIFLSLGTILPYIFTHTALASINQQTGEITNTLGFWGSCLFYILTGWS